MLGHEAGDGDRGDDHGRGSGRFWSPRFRVSFFILFGVPGLGSSWGNLVVILGRLGNHLGAILKSNPIRTDPDRSEGLSETSQTGALAVIVSATVCFRP